MSSIGILATAGVTALFLIIIWTHHHGRSVFGFLVGVTAGLVGVQLGGIHAFTLVTVVWSIYPGGVWRKNLIPRLLLLGFSSSLLALTSILGALVNSQTLALQLLALTGSAILIALRGTVSDVNSILRGLLTTVTMASVIGLLQVLGVISLELWHLNVSSIGRPTGLYPEPDWLGLFAGIGLLIVWRLPLSTLGRVSLFAINSAAFILAFARAAWLGIFAVVLVALVLKVSRGRLKRSTGNRSRFLALSATALAGLITLALVPALRDDLLTRISTLMGSSPTDDISGEARIRQVRGLLELAESAPFYGHGLSAAGRVSVWGELELHNESRNNVASNWLLGFWVDGNYFSVPLILFLVILVLVTARSLFGQLLIVVLVNSLFSNAFFFPITWLLIGLALIVTTEDRRQLSNEHHMKRENYTLNRVGSTSST